MSDVEPRDPMWVSLDVAQPIWPHVFTVAPLVLIGTREEDGAVDLAPKHMVSPMSRDDDLERIVDGFGTNSLIVGRIVAARVRQDAMRGMDRDDNALVAESPLLAYLHPGRWARIDRSQAFPFHTGFQA